MLQPSDFTYLGAIRMPAGGVDTTFAYGGMSGRIVNGRVHFFVYGNNVDGDQVYEIEDPGTGYSTDYRFAPRASLVTAWGDIYHGKRHSWDVDGTSITLQNLFPGDLYWNENTQLLYWTYADGYNVTHRPDWGLGATSLDDPSSGRSTAYGPWRAQARDADGSVFYGPWRCLYLFARPSDGTMLCGSSAMSGISASPWGPDVYGGAAWPTANTAAASNAPDVNLTRRYLEYYFMGNPNSGNYVDLNGAVHGRLRSFRRVNEQAVWEDYNITGSTPSRANPALNGGVGSWTEVDSTSGAVWLELNNKHGVIFAGTLAGAVSQNPNDCVNAAHEWYSSPGLHPPNGACAHGCAPPIEITGPVVTAAFPAFMVYNPDSLELVGNGILDDYSIEPNVVMDLEQLFNIRTAPVATLGAGKVIRGFYFDPVRKYLFTLAARADNSRVGDELKEALIHVFAIRD